MLELRTPQVDALRAMRDDELAGRIARYLRRVEPERCAVFSDEDDLIHWVHERLGRALALGIRQPWDRTRLARYSLVYGVGFEQEQPWAQQIFARGLDGTACMDRVERTHRDYLEPQP